MAEPAYLLFIESNTTGSGMQALVKARELGLEPVFFVRNADLYPTLKQFVGAVIATETNDLTLLNHAVITFLERYPGKIHGITTTSEFYLEITAQLAADYALPTNPPSMLANCRDKLRTRQILTEAGLPQPRFFNIANSEEVEAAVSHVGLPCIVKPREDTGSFGVKMCRSKAEVQAHARRLLSRSTNHRGQTTTGTILCEEYINGPEFSVETFTWQGEITCIGITEKKVAGSPYCVEAGHIFPANLSEKVRAQMESTVFTALQVLGSYCGPVHTEVKWTGNSGVIVEINARLAGGMIPELILQATGLDLLKCQLMAACGHRPDICLHTAGYAGITFIMAPATGRFAGVQGMVVEELPYIVQAVITAPLHKLVSPPRSAYDRLGYVIAREETYPALVERLECIQQMIHIHIGDTKDA